MRLKPALAALWSPFAALREAVNISHLFVVLLSLSLIGRGCYLIEPFLAPLVVGGLLWLDLSITAVLILTRPAPQPTEQSE